MATPTAITKGFAQKGSIKKKDLISQSSSMLSSGQAYLDTTGIATSQERRNDSRSVRNQIRRLTASDNSQLYLQTQAAYVWQILKFTPPGNVVSFINQVKQALASAASATELAAPAAASSISLKKLIHSMIFVEINGKHVLDDLGGDFTNNCYHPQVARSARQLMRLVIRKNPANSRTSLNTASGILLRAINDASVGTMANINTVISNTFQPTNADTARLEAPAQASSTSLLNQVQDLLVVTADGSVAINDTGDSSSQAQLKKSQLAELRDLIESNGEATPTFRIQTTSGLKLRKVANLDITAASFAALKSALTANA